MKYLIQNTKEFLISCGVFATFLVLIFWVVWAIVHNDLGAQHLVAFVAAVFEFLGWYYNMPTSSENCVATGKMRLQKALKNMDRYIGENFDEEPEDVEEGEDDE